MVNSTHVGKQRRRMGPWLLYLHLPPSFSCRNKERRGTGKEEAGRATTFDSDIIVGGGGVGVGREEDTRPTLVIDRVSMVGSGWEAGCVVR